MRQPRLAPEHQEIVEEFGRRDQEHDEQRREVSSTVNPVTLAKMEDLIRTRTNMVLDKLPRNE